ncbi:MAG: glycosyltransferase family 39 protein [Nitrospinae bacterium]|nr:glycosyltransferase family 39 protein [Nitrospinota bacterium]
MALFSSENIWAPRSISIASGTGVVAMTCIIARRIIPSGAQEGTDKRSETFWTNAPFVGALLLAINPIHIGYTSTVGNEPIFSLWLMFALYFLLRTEKTNNYAYLAAFFVFLASLTRFEIWVLFPFIIWVLIKQQRVTTMQFVVSSGIVALGPLIWIWNQENTFGSWHLFLDFYLSGAAAAVSATGDSLLNAKLVIIITGIYTFGISWYVFYYGFRKLISSQSMKTAGNHPPRN